MKTPFLAVSAAILLTPMISLAARPSFTELQQQINQLRAEITELQATVSTQDSRLDELESLPKHPIVVDANGKLLGLSLGNRFDNGRDINYHHVEFAVFANSESFIFGFGNNFSLGEGVYFPNPIALGMRM